MDDNPSQNGFMRSEIQRHGPEFVNGWIDLKMETLAIANLLVTVSLNYCSTSGPGYRIYFAHSDNMIILLLCGGNKSSQRQDIARAKNYWAQYKEAQG